MNCVIVIKYRVVVVVVSDKEVGHGEERCIHDATRWAEKNNRHRMSSGRHENRTCCVHQLTENVNLTRS